MVTSFSQLRLAAAAASLSVAALLMAACSSPHSPPTQTSATNPTVTYRYRGDEELVSANEKAAAYCSQYRSVPQTVRIDNESDGSKTVVFDCIATAAPATTTMAYNPNDPYVYHSDQDLLAATQSADAYCRNSGSMRAVTTVSSDSTGAKTITFRCVPQ
ncbi:MAG TPA: hypothetical protein VHA10_18390 [Hypericibacter adhaerens]|jgi:hypothetical protein|uniref:Lipoprotein n=1 Tax=Hypericibacter adhaerens TaxID=2602016 RepID=A0A5J6MWS4_9PROT|nr:hypothetical protein [Hypericibacter adhaerens]QEX21949.1 hypothetical protein FRZ61_18780 [Hypericibacter adhaerens]HWA45196.1 hypothetical protein [Hypericibacter adhaerens]